MISSRPSPNEINLFLFIELNDPLIPLIDLNLVHLFLELNRGNFF